MTGMLEPRASRTATAFLSIRHVIDASCISPSGIGDAKQIGSGEMPTLRGFDEEFGQAAGVTQLDRTRSIFAVALGAAILGGLTLVWLAVDGGVRPKGASAAPTSPQNTALAESRELVDRLLSQVEALKSEVRELTEAQQQLAQANAAIEAEQESPNRAPPVHWYSDPAALSSGSRAALSRGRRAASATASEPTSITNRASLNFAMAPTRSMIS